jgi:hypothetical protein
MGWCSATEIMDIALAAADQAVTDLLGHLGSEIDKPRRELVDATLRPFVVRLANHLRDGDWDCIEESAFFSRFPQEMLGHTDDEYENYLVEKLHWADPSERPDLACRLYELYIKMGAENVTG